MDLSYFQKPILLRNNDVNKRRDPCSTPLAAVFPAE
jgi:hypothetical protein